MFVGILALVIFGVINCHTTTYTDDARTARAYNGTYEGPHLNRIAFPIGGIGAGMIGLEGTGALSHVSLRNEPDIYNEPCTFAAVSVKGYEKGVKVLEGPVPDWKVFGQPRTGNGAAGSSFGLPRFEDASFTARFPFGVVELEDEDVPLQVRVVGWSPFVPGDADNSSLPVGALEYRFKNRTDKSLEAIFSFNAKNFMATGEEGEGSSVKPIEKGFVLWQDGTDEAPHHQGGFAAFVEEDGEEVVVDHCWFRGGWFDPMTLAWKNIEEGVLRDTSPQEGTCPGGSLYVPFTLEAGEEKTVRLMLAWYVPRTDL